MNGEINARFNQSNLLLFFLFRIILNYLKVRKKYFGYFFPYKFAAVKKRAGY
jgi:hypothetical protein